MLAGSASDRIRFEEAFKENAEKYRAAGDLSFTDWRNVNNNDLSSGTLQLFYRKRLNNDGTYEFLDVRPRKDGTFYAKNFVLNANAEKPEDHREVLTEAVFFSPLADDLPELMAEMALDSQEKYLEELIYGYPENQFVGKNFRGVDAKDSKDCICSKDEVRIMAGRLGIDPDFTVPAHIHEHFDPEHNREF